MALGNYPFNHVLFPYICLFLVFALLISTILIILKGRKLRNKLQLTTNSLQEQSSFFQATLNSLAEGAVVTDKEGIIVFANQPASKFTGLRVEEMVGKHFTEVIKFKQELTGHSIEIPYKDVIEKRYVVRREDDVVMEKNHNYELFVGFSVAPIIKNELLADGMVIVFWDISLQRDIRLALLENEAKFRGIFEVANDAILLVTLDGIIVDANPAASKISKYQCQELIGKNISSLLADVSNQKIEEVIVKVKKQHAISLRVDSKCKDGSLVPIEVSMRVCTIGKAKHIVVVARDITERKRYEETIRRQALHDPLTELPNRVLFKERLEKSIARAKRYNHKVAVMFMDLDNFKDVNDRYGHFTGDLLLKGIGQRLVGTLRQEDTVARLGGDEFTILLPQINMLSDAELVAKKICHATRVPWFINGYEFGITFSVGIAMYPDDGKSVDELIESADKAMYRAKLSGKNNYEFFSKENLPS
jgi:diguanylate cyclase (GGDEF)-like protein/PAS domain S-box-containing protein